MMDITNINMFFIYIFILCKLSIQTENSFFKLTHNSRHTGNSYSISVLTQVECAVRCRLNPLCAAANFGFGNCEIFEDVTSAPNTLTTSTGWSFMCKYLLFPKKKL